MKEDKDIVGTSIENWKNITENESEFNMINSSISDIRETIYHTANAGSPAEPTGYSYRIPENLPSMEENEPSSEKYEKDTKSLVNYRTDMGGVSYHPTLEDLKEEALRRIIRRKLQEQKKNF